MSLKNIVPQDSNGPYATPVLARTQIFMKGVKDYCRYYFKGLDYPADQEFYLVYTNLDHKIPFNPEKAVAYWGIIAKSFIFQNRIGAVTPKGYYGEILDAFVDIAYEGRIAFREVPTILPRFKAHRNTLVAVIQKTLDPIRACPSLHVAAPFLGYNLGRKYLPGREQELRREIQDVILAIIGTKLHALVDIPFGMWLSKSIVEEKLQLEFDNLEDFFTNKKNSEEIPYDYIFKVYHKIEGLAEKMPKNSGHLLPQIMELYFKEIGLPKVTRKDSNCFFDLEKRCLVSAKELKAGKGLF
jgi:hypothetical protein